MSYDFFQTKLDSPLQSFDEIGEGKDFPPKRNVDRIKLYNRYYDWSHRKYTGLLEQLPDRQLRFDTVTRNRVQRLSPNMFKFVKTFFEHVILSDPPAFEYDGPERVNEFIQATAPNVVKASKIVIGDMIRYGVGLFFLRHAMSPETLDPRFWFPVRTPYDLLSNEGGDIVAMPYSDNSVNLDRLLVIKYQGAGVTATIYTLEGLQIKAPLKQVPMEYLENALIPVRMGEGFFGSSDYADIAEYVAELHCRESQLANSLDKHSNPHLAVPEGSVKVEADGSVNVNNDGLIIPFPEGSNPPQYVTWDAKFEFQESDITRAEDRILRLSGISPVLLSPASLKIQGGAQSGVALRRMSVITVNKIQSIRESLDSAYKLLFPALGVQNGQAGELVEIDPDKLSIVWPAPLSTGFTDDADAIKSLVDSGALTQETALQLTEKVSRKRAEELSKEQRENEPQQTESPGGRS